MRYSIPLVAGAPQKQFFRGRGLSLVSTGAAAGVTLSVFRSDIQDVEEFGECDRNFSIYYQDGLEFSGAEFTSTVDTVIDVIVSRARVTLTDGQDLTATIAAAQLPLPVDPGRGDAPGNPFYVSGLSITDTPAATISNGAAVAVGDTVAAVLAASATRLQARFTNIGLDAVAIGGAGLTWAARCVVLQPGDTWVEEKAAALAWYAITDAGGSASVTVQGLSS